MDSNINSWKYKFSSSPCTSLITLLMGTTSNPLFSSIITLYLLILLYFPHCFLKLVISPILTSTLILLLSLLRLGASQQTQNLQQSSQPPRELKLDNVEDSSFELEIQLSGETQPKITPESGSQSESGSEFESESKSDPEPIRESEESACIYSTQEVANVELHFNRAEIQPPSDPGSGTKTDPVACSGKDGKRERGPVTDPKASYPHIKSFEEWDVWAPLKVIYEAYEGDEIDDERQIDALVHNHHGKPSLETCPSLGDYHLESKMSLDTDTDTDMDTDSLCSLASEDFLEIALGYGCGDDERVTKNVIKKFTVDDEDNLIEIDISPTRSNSEFGW